MVVELVMRLVRAQTEENLLDDVNVRGDAHHGLHEGAEHVGVDPHGDALDVLVRSPIEHHQHEGALKFDLEDLGEAVRLGEYLQ